VRVLDQLENGGHGLNLCFEVLDAIEKSSKAREDIFAEGWGVPVTLEGQVVKTADAIAYVNHDILDAIRAGLLTEADLPLSARQQLGGSHAERLNTLICDIVEASWGATGEQPGTALPRITFSPRVHAAANELREFMFQRVYLYDTTRSDAERGKKVVSFLFHHFVRNPGGISPDFSLPGDPVERRAADYVSGMTDRYAIRLAISLGCDDALGWST
jgi:dGTPase